MGWSSASDIFDPVATALVELDAPDEMKTRVLGALIGALQAGDWDTEGESLDRFQDDSAIVEAFRLHDVIAICCLEGPEPAQWCELERGHGGRCKDEDGNEFDPVEDGGED